MADITKELNAIQIGCWGYDIRKPIHDALKAIADETPAIDPNGPWYLIDSEGEYIVTNMDEDYVVAMGYNYFFIVDHEGEFIVTDAGDDYLQAKE